MAIRVQFSMKSLGLILVVCATGAALFAYSRSHIIRRNRTVDKLLAERASVVWDFEIGGAEPKTRRDVLLGRYSQHYVASVHVHEQISLDTIRSIRSFSRLDLIHLGPHVLNDKVAALLTDVRSCRVLESSYATIGAKGLQSICSLPNLVELDLSNANGLTSLSPIANLSKLRHLILDGAVFDGSTVEFLCSCKSLLLLSKLMLLFQPGGW